MMGRFPGFIAVAVVVVAAFAGCSGKSKSEPPVASFKITPEADGVTFLFDATNSSSPDGGRLTYGWSFGDGGTADGPLIEYTYAITDVEVQVGLVVRDASGHGGAATKPLKIGTGVNHAPQVQVRNATRWVAPGGGIVLDASQSSDPDQDLFLYEWILGNRSETPPPEASFDSGNLQPGQSFNQTFDALGVYDVRCHTHPWMRARIVVAASSNASLGTEDVEVTNYTFTPRNPTIQPGSTIRFVNRDPLVHTASLEYFSPGVIAGTQPVLSTSIAEGSYLLRLVLDDGKGGVATQTFGLKASTDAPASPLLTYKNDTLPAQPGAVTPQTPYRNTDYLSYQADWPQNLTGTVGWSDPGGQSNWEIILRDGNKTFILASCLREETSCSFVLNVLPGAYKVGLDGDSAAVSVNVDVRVQLTAIQYTRPGFGDAGPSSTVDGR